jgi:hypothetical protein
MAFNGLRRTLGAHPESLSRALRRLERYGRVARTEHGYRLVDSVDVAHASGLNGSAARPAPASERTLAQIRLSPGLSGEEVLGRLAGRWFGPLRWVGLFDRPGEPRLVWSRADGSGLVSLGVRAGVLRVYGERSTPDTAGDEEAARQLLAHALERLGDAPAERRPGSALGFALALPPRATLPN